MTDCPSFIFNPGTTPLIVGLPHAGTAIPDAIAATMTDAALTQPDTAHHVARLVDFPGAMGIGTLASVYCRYVIDLNRSPDGLNRHAGVDNTTLCPTERFDRAPIYREGMAPDSEEVGRRLDLYWRPYHDALRAALDAAHARHGRAVLLDVHTIPRDVARFYDTRSPDLSLKSGGRIRASGDLVERLEAVLRQDARYGVEVDGRFKGGFIVQHYGAPEEGLHSLQIEISQANYLDMQGRFDPATAAPLRTRLRATVEVILDWASRKGGP